MRKRAVAETLRTLMAAVVLGLLIWYIARNEITGEEEIEAAIQVINAQDCRVESPKGGPVRVRVVLAGPIQPLRRVRDAIERQEIVGRLRLTPEQRTSGGTLVIPIAESIFKPLGDSRVRLRLAEHEVELVVTPLVSLVKPVTLDIPDLDPSRYRVRVLVPRDVLVWGPKSLLARISEVKTQPLGLARIFDAGRRDFQGTLEIAKVIDGQRIECDERVYVDIVFGEETVERTFKDVPVLVVTKPGFPYEVRLEPDHRTATVLVRGPRSVVLGDPKIVDQILVFLVIGDLKPSTTPNLIEPQHRLPPGVTVVNTSLPDKVSVDILEREAPASG